MIECLNFVNFLTVLTLTCTYINTCVNVWMHAHAFITQQNENTKRIRKLNLKIWILKWKTKILRITK